MHWEKFLGHSKGLSLFYFLLIHMVMAELKQEAPSICFFFQFLLILISLHF